MWKPIEHVRKRRENEKKGEKKRNWDATMIVLCCTTKCWPVTYICSDYTYVPVPPHKKEKKRETVPTGIQNNEVITVRESHTHIHIRTYIYVSIYVGCATFFSRESRTPWGESQTNRWNRSTISRKMSNLILFHRMCLLFLFFLRKAIIMFYREKLEKKAQVQN